MPPRSEPEPTAGIILAAGAATRMGANKMRLRLGDEAVVHRAARIAREAGLARIIVVLGSDADGVRSELAGIPCDFVINPEFTGPTSGSLHRGLRSIPTDIDSAVVLLGDMVAVTPEMILGLTELARQTGAPLAVSRYGDVLAPPLFFRRSLFPEFLAWHGEGCGKAVVKRHLREAAYLDWPTSALFDIDTPADLAAARALDGAAAEPETTNDPHASA